jgi:hypothetical protein
MPMLRRDVHSAPLEEFDFERVSRMMQIVNWIWFPGGTAPSAARLRHTARTLVDKLGTDLERPDGSNLRITEISSGGLVATLSKGNVTLSFEAATQGKNPSTDLSRLLDAWEKAGNPGIEGYSSRKFVAGARLPLPD